MANIWRVDRTNNKVEMGTTGTTINIDSHTASLLLSLDASKDLESVSDLTAWVAGTSNQIIVTDDTDGTITLSTPQDIHTGASPTFVDVTATNELIGPKAKITVIGGFAIKLTNKTGANTVAGQIVMADPDVNDAIVLCDGDTTADSGDIPIGVFLDSGVADGSEAWVVTGGIADVAIEDNVAAVRSYWVGASADEDGYADIVDHPKNAPDHFHEIGHCIENVAAGGGGTHILARCVLHFN